MTLIDIIGTIAAILTTLSFLPQTVKAIRIRNLEGLSLTMYILFTTGIFLWLIYGILIGAWPIITANAITFGLALIILIMLLRDWQRRRKL